MAYPDVDAGQLSGDAADVGLAVMVGEEHLGIHHLGGMHELVRGHGEGLVAGQEGDVDADLLEVGHLGNVLGVAGDVDAQAVEGEDIAVVAPLGVEL